MCLFQKRYWASTAGILRPDNITFLRFAFTGAVIDYDPDRALDAGILRVGWFSLDEIRAMSYDAHRSPLVMECIEHHLAGRRYPLEILSDLN